MLPKVATDMILMLIAITDISPLHGVMRPEYRDELAGNMRENGWDGRPLVAYKDDANHVQALTGSHRFAAAKTAGIAEIPCVLLDADQVEALANYWDKYGTVRAEDAEVAMRLAGYADIADLFGQDC